MKPRWTWLLALVPAVALASGDFAWQWPLQLSAPAASAYRVPLDADVYRAAWWPDLRDVRVMDADGQPMPSQVQAAEALPAQMREVELPWFPLPASTGAGAGDDLSVVVQRSSDGQVLSIRNASPGGRASDGGALLVDLGDHAGRVRALRMDWGAADGSVDVGYRVDGSHDLRQWFVLDPDARVIALRNADHALGNNRLPLASRFRYVRLIPLQGVAAPALRGVRGEVTEDRDAGDWQWLDVPAATPTDAAKRSYHYRVDGRFPIQRLRLVMRANSSARWRVWNRADAADGRTGAADWRQVAAAWNTWRLGPGGGDASPPLKLPVASSARAWRLQLIAGSDMQAPVLQLGYRPGAIVFLAQGRAPYRLVAGRADAAVTADVMQPVLAALRARNGHAWQPLVASLGSRTALAGDAAYLPAPRDWKTWILWAVLALGAATVAWFALRLLRTGRPPDAG